VYSTSQSYYGESGYFAYNQPVYRTASGTRWNAVNNWSGQANISSTLSPGTYQVTIETAYTAAAGGPIEGGFYDYADGTWGTNSNTITVNVGLQVRPTYVRWATS